ncbi:peptidoglycan-binding protein [Ancylobacter sp. MQZ15Z-1]|uniref:Peptidoglycan-binding protein n=1 Tax=Ancylobacter mangrovi TaxID=2972472 RepID=A0A9X2T104_9HYPH|nr:peptidoglycan-binding domain-containing protein [Ancylobacter mangrovi]MCS0494212.1 peptidoglycan-binding protein [Ancylobacter mangrovi]
MPRSYASDLLEDDIDLDGERAAGRPYQSGRRRSDVFMTVLAAGATAAVLFNALGLQERRHSGGTPAPIAAPAALREVPAAPAAASPAAIPAPAPSPVMQAAPEASTPAMGTPDAASAAAPVMPLPPVKPAAPPRAAPAVQAPTALAPAPAAPANAVPGAGSPRPPADIAVSPRVMEIQKALASLGYGPIHIDGRVGDATRQAIERFERDRRMPVTGEISDRLVRELDTVAGFSIR